MQAYSIATLTSVLLLLLLLLLLFAFLFGLHARTLLSLRTLAIGEVRQNKRVRRETGLEAWFLAQQLPCQGHLFSTECRMQPWLRPCCNMLQLNYG